MNQQVITVAKPYDTELIVKKSRFVAHAERCDNADDAIKILQRVQRMDATHHCWAYKIGQNYRFSDDGEPGGTAGRPIFVTIEAQGIDHVMVIVIRYFGGIKLGAGGLVRAYSGVASQCLRQAEKVALIRMITAVIRANFDDIGQLYPAMQQFQVQKCSEQFTSQGVELTVIMRQQDYDLFCQAVKNSTRGRATVALPK